MSDTKYQPIIGLEVHVELATKSKMFCGCPADHFGKEPNTITCPVCLGLPGALPVPNKKAIDWTILLGLALGCEIPLESKFDRKHYFYPDLPKGYQISQYDMPLAIDGHLDISMSFPRMRESSVTVESMDPRLRGDDDKRTIRIRRVHLEEDTGKLQHAEINGEKVSLVDFNRSGVPLVEIVTEPDFRNVDEVDVYLKKLQQIIRYLGISNADMEKGSMRIEPSVSLRGVTDAAIPPSEIVSPSERSRNDIPGYRVEIKNINSFKFAKKAIEYEIERQTQMLERGETPIQQTRGYVESKGITAAQRDKEEAHDYRYFPEPDIPPMRWDQLTINNLQLTIPELPEAKKERFMKQYGLSDYDAGLLVETKTRADFFEEVVKLGTPKAVANIIINKKATTKEEVASFFQRQPTVSDDELEKIIKQVLAENSKAVEDYKKGKEQALGFLVGAVVRRSGTRGNQKNIVSFLKESLSLLR